VDSENISPSVVELSTTDTGAFDEFSTSAPRGLDEDSTNARRALAPEGKGKEGKGIKPNTSKPKSGFDENGSPDYLAIVHEVWGYYLATIGRNPTLYTLTGKRKSMGVARARPLAPGGGAEARERYRVDEAVRGPAQGKSISQR